MDVGSCAGGVIGGVIDRGWGKPGQQMEIEHKETTLAITADMTPQQAAEAFIATIRGAQVVDHKLAEAKLGPPAFTTEE